MTFAFKYFVQYIYDYNCNVGMDGILLSKDPERNSTNYVSFLRVPTPSTSAQVLYKGFIFHIGKNSQTFIFGFMHLSISSLIILMQPINARQLQVHYKFQKQKFNESSIYQFIHAINVYTVRITIVIVEKKFKAPHLKMIMK